MRASRWTVPLIAFVVAASLAACGSGSSGPPVNVVGGQSAPAAAGDIPPPSPQLGDIVNITVPPRIRNLPLTTAAGQTTTLAAYAGKPVMIADFLSLCTDICPMISANTAAMARALQQDGEAQRVALVEISVDPTRDSPARLRAYQKLYGGSLPDWTLLRASPADTKTLWKFFHVYYHRVKEPHPAAIDWLTHKPLTYDVEHSDALIFLGSDGKEHFVVNGGPDVQHHLPPGELVQFLDGEGVHDLYHPQKADSWTVTQGLQVFSWLTGRKLAAPT